VSCSIAVVIITVRLMCALVAFCAVVRIRTWRRDQLWKVMRAIVQSPDKEIDYKIARDKWFHGENSPLLELVSLDVVSVRHVADVPNKLRAGMRRDLLVAILSVL
jgi:hypothetical protein